MVFKFFDKKTGSGVIGKAGVSVNEQLVEELHKPVILKRRKVYARFEDNIWAADLAEMESFSSKNNYVKYFLCIVDVFIKSWVKTSKDKKGKIVLNNFIEIVN